MKRTSLTALIRSADLSRSTPHGLHQCLPRQGRRNPSPSPGRIVSTTFLAVLGTLASSSITGCSALWIFKSSHDMGASASIDRPAMKPVPAAKAEIIEPTTPATEQFGNQTPLAVDSTANPTSASRPSHGSSSNSSAAPAGQRPLEVSLQSLSSYKVHEGEISALAVTRDGLGVFTGGIDGRVVFSRIITSDPKSKQASGARRVERKTILQGSKQVLSLALSNDNRYLAIGQFSSVLVFDLKQNSIIAQQTQLIGRIVSLAWDPRDELLAIGQAGGDVNIWQLKNGNYPGANSLTAVEKYNGSEGSPVIKLVFHPLGRVLFAGHRSGQVSAWRVIRAEFEAGLRDQDAVADLDRKGGKRTRIGSTTGPLQDLWFDRKLNALEALGLDGAIQRWEIRGTTQLPLISVGEDNSNAVVSFAEQNEKIRGQIIASVGTAQRIVWWCVRPTADTPEIVSVPGDVPIYREDAAAAAGAAGNLEIINGQVVVNRPESSVPPPPSNTEVRGIKKNVPTLKPLGYTTILRDPVSFMLAGERSPVLWAVQKNGRLLSFDARPLLEQMTGGELCR